LPTLFIGNIRQGGGIGRRVSWGRILALTDICDICNNSARV